ncbi:unnamed protein product, partial [Mesorhabditis spiculigera]
MLDEAPARPRKAATGSGARARTAGPAAGAGANGGLWRFYTEDSTGLKIGPVPVLVMSLVFIACVFVLHIWGNERIDHSLDWSVKNLRLFPEKDPRNKVPLNFMQSFVQASLHRKTVKWIVDEVKMDKMLAQFNTKKYGGDEYWLGTLHGTPELGMPGAVKQCSAGVKLGRPLSRTDTWNPYFIPIRCKSHYMKHSICVLGVENLSELRESIHYSANKVQPSFDWAVASCMAEHLFNAQHHAHERLSEKRRHKYEQLRIVRCHQMQKHEKSANGQEFRM